MTEEQRAEIKKALIKCAEENEGKNTFTGYVIVSSVCKAGAERIAELEEENAELKKKNLAIQDAVTMQMYTNKANKEIADRQLTKAKELLKQWLQTSNASSCDNINIVIDTEQFLKE